MPVQEARPTGGLHELSLLATLIKPNATKATNFKLNLFGDSTQLAQASAGGCCLTITCVVPLYYLHVTFVLPAYYLGATYKSPSV